MHLPRFENANLSMNSMRFVIISTDFNSVRLYKSFSDKRSPTSGRSSFSDLSDLRFEKLGISICSSDDSSRDSKSTKKCINRITIKQ